MPKTNHVRVPRILIMAREHSEDYAVKHVESGKSSPRTNRKSLLANLTGAPRTQMRLSNKMIVDQPWSEWVRRVFLHVPRYLSSDGRPTSGGRQRKTRDIANLIKHQMGIDCLIVQKGVTDWTATDQDDNVVIGLRSRPDIYGDPGFGRRTSSLLRRQGDAIVYIGGEDAWPFFTKNAKAYHVGVWWDGPHSSAAKWLTGVRTRQLFHACRSVACCDTNVINWLRTHSSSSQRGANRSVYIPNCVNLNDLAIRSDEPPNKPLKILFARRFELKRGPYLMLDAAKILADRGFVFELTMSSAQGSDGTDLLRAEAKKRGLDDHVATPVNDMDSILSIYGNFDIAVVPTLWSEGTSYAAIEAVAAGLPVVTTTVGGLPNVVFPGFNGQVCPPEAQAIADAIEVYSEQSVWERQHKNCLSMRDSLSADLWKKRVLKWLMS